MREKKSAGLLFQMVFGFHRRRHRVEYVKRDAERDMHVCMHVYVWLEWLVMVVVILIKRNWCECVFFSP